MPSQRQKAKTKNSRHGNLESERKVEVEVFKMRSRGGASSTVTEQQITQSTDQTGKKKKRKVKKKTVSSFSIFLILFFGYSMPPLIIRYSSWVKDAVIYVHHVREPFFANISDPQSFGLKAARQFELLHKDNCGIEVWQLLPKKYHDAGHISENDFEQALSDSSSVVMYLHGNTGTRGTSHRVRLYKYLSDTLGHHVITFDYRGFGNSRCYPSEKGMMEDALLVWRWLKEKAPDARIYIWGHSLGSAAATYLAQMLSLSHQQTMPSGLILDAPFTNLVEAGQNHPLTLPYWPVIRLFSYLTFESFEEKFSSVDRILDVLCPILIMHGQRDRIVPFYLGKKLYQRALDYRKKHGEVSFGSLEFVDCNDAGHKTNWEFAKKNVKVFIK